MVLGTPRRWFLGLAFVWILLVSACAGGSTPTQPAGSVGASPSAPPPSTSAPAPSTSAPADDATPAGAAAVSTPSPPAATPSPEPEPTVAAWSSDIAPAPERPAAWYEPFESDPEAIETVLDNGLRVIVRRNDSPGSQAQLRLVVDAGSLEEAPDALGAAHFLEHMMFNGTERFPGNELVPVLESFGAGFGPDLNAYTSYSETVYQLTVPSRDPAVVDLALDVLVEWASAATIEPDAVEAERGVVREEWRRSQESVGGRVGEQVRDVLFADSAYYRRAPLGPIESIETLTADDLRSYYETWYRPDNMAVIIVGDIDPAATLDAVAAAFGVLTNPPSGLPEPSGDLAAGGLAEPVYDVLVDPEISRTEVEVRWRVDGGPILDRADEHRSWVRAIAATLLNQRLFEAVERSESVATTAGAQFSGLTPQLDLLTVRAEVGASHVDRALVELLTAVEQLRQHPISNDEFDRAVDQMLSSVEQRFAESSSVQDRALAAAYVDAVLGHAIVVDPATDFRTSQAVIQQVTTDDVRRFIDDALEGEPYVLVTAPARVLEMLAEPETLALGYDSVVGRRVDAPAAPVPTPDVLMEAPEPAAVISRDQIGPLSATVVTFANGATVAIRPSTIVENRVEFRATSRGGYFQETGPAVALLGRSANLIVPSGFESVDSVARTRLLADQVVSLSADIGRATEWLSGEAAVGNIETLLQLIHLQMTEPTITPLSVRRFDDAWRPIATDPTVRPTIAADLELWRLRYGDSPYYRLIPTLEDLDRLDPAVQLDAFRERYANAGDFVFVFVGDVEVESFIDLAARYIGTLPAEGDRDEPVDRDPGVPEANLVSTVAVGVGEQGRLRMNWESPYPFTLRAEVAAEVLDVVVDARLRDLVREELGASYAPSATVTVVREPKPWVDTIIELDTDPDRLDEVSRVIRDELTRIRAGDLDSAYLDLAVEQVTEGYRFFSNREWIELVTFHLAHPERDPGEYRNREAIARSLTVAELAETAAVVFPESRSVEVRMVPAD